MGSITNPTSGGSSGLTVSAFDVGTLGIPAIDQISPFTGRLYSADLWGQLVGATTFGNTQDSIGALSVAAFGNNDLPDPTSAVPIFRVQRRRATVFNASSINIRDVNSASSRFARTSNTPFFPWIIWQRFGFGNTGKTDGRFFQGVASNADLNVTAALPSTFFNIAGIGKDDSDTNIQFMYNDNAGVATKVDTGFVYATSMTTIFDLFVSFDGTNVAVRLIDLINGADVIDTQNSNIPAIDTRLNLQGVWGGGSLTVGFVTICMNAWGYYQPIG